MNPVSISTRCISLVIAGATMVAALAPACGGAADGSEFGNGGPDGSVYDPNNPIFVNPGDQDANAPKPCVSGLCKQVVACPSGTTTSLSGKIYDPAGKNPLYNVVVYVPNAPVEALKTGASCDRCGTLSGDPITTALTDASGSFKLANVPVGDNIPVVIQVGKWRRQIVIPTVGKCVDTPVAAALARLPKNQSEGDIPQIAITTGGADVMECFLRKVGLDDAEFTTNAGTGRVHFYKGADGGDHAAAQFDGAHGGASFPPANAFWKDKNNLVKYDMVLLSCEGETAPKDKPAEALQALYDYTAIGGRVFASHWHRYWLSTEATSAGNKSPFEALGAFTDRKDPVGNATTPINATIDTSFPKGKAMSEWLHNVGASPTTQGQIQIHEARHNVDSVNASAQQWITLQNPNANNMTAVEYMSFNTPIPAADDKKCGRMVYSDLHVSSGDQTGADWPSGCKTTDLSPQEKALEFMLFDLSSCIQNDKAEPRPPI